MSNKVPKLAAEKIKSAPKKSTAKNKIKLLGWLWLGVLGILLILIFTSVIVTLVRQPARLKINGHTYSLLVAKTPAEKSKGLGGRSSLPQNKDMLFVFEGEATRCFWMRDMNFPLDMVWLNSNRQILNIQPDISPATYPETFCANNKPAQYVVELNAGQAAKSDMQVGQTVQITGV